MNRNEEPNKPFLGYWALTGLGLLVTIIVLSIFLIICAVVDCAVRDHRSQLQPIAMQETAPSYPPRIEITKIEVITDRLAYDNKRGVYLIKDTKTGIEYLGVSGIGISELGDHMAGKTTVSDER